MGLPSQVLRFRTLPCKSHGGDEGGEGDEGHEGDEGKEGQQADGQGRRLPRWQDDGATTLTKGDLIKNKAGRIVSKKQSLRAKKMYAKGIGKWTAALQKARKALGTKGFVAVKKGSPLYKKARESFTQ